MFEQAGSSCQRLPFRQLMLVFGRWTTTLSSITLTEYPRSHTSV